MEETVDTEVKTDVSQGEESSQGARPKDTPGTPEYEQSRYDKLIKQVEQKEGKWTQEKQNLINELNQLKQGFESIKNPPKPEPTAPVRPSDPDDYPAWIKYNNEMLEYKDEIHRKELSEIKSLVTKTTSELEEEKKAKTQQKVQSEHKALYVSGLSQNGLSPDEAISTYDAFISLYGKPAEEAIPLMAEFGAFLRSKKIKPTDPAKPGFTPKIPPGATGGTGGEKVPQGTFITDSDTSWIYKTK